MMAPSFLATPPPTVAVGIDAAEATAVSLSAGRGRPSVETVAVEPLPAGLVTPSLTAANVADPARLGARLRGLLDRLGTSPRRIALVLPDVVAKVSLVRLEQVPARQQDLAGLLQFHVRKAAPFNVEEALIAWVPGAGGHEFVVTLARRDVIAEYEQACEAAGAHAGLVDLATFNLANAVIAAEGTPAGDWLLVHVAPGYCSLAILRGADVLFFRSRPGDDHGDLGDLVHQTAMYYEDRLGGQRFDRVRLAGWARTLGTGSDQLRQRLEGRLGMRMEQIDTRELAPFASRIGASPELLDQVAPLVGILMRDRVPSPAGAR